MGNTDTSVETVPFIRGGIRRDSATLLFSSLVLPARLAFEIDLGAGVTAYDIAVGSQAINTIIDNINAVIGGAGHRAFDMGGVIHIEAASGGAGSYIRTVPTTLGPNDAAVELGFPLWPDPQAHMDGGDQSSSPFTITEQNPLGTAYASDGEDVTAQVLNRAVDALAVNSDKVHSLLERELALPMIIELAPGDPRLILDGGLNYAQADISGLVAGYPGEGYSDRVYLGRGLTNLSSLEDIAQYFAVTDQDHVEIISGGNTVRVAGVTHGLRPGLAPVFGAGELAPPTANVIPNVAAWVPLDGGNLLGQDFVKAGPVAISEVVYRTAVRVVGETFTTKGVVARDKAVIAGGLVDEPFNHDGDYFVEQAVDEELLFLRGDESSRGELNPDDTVALGSVTISSGGEFAEGTFLSFVPPIPAGTSVRIIVGGGYEFGSMPMDHFLQLIIATSEEVDSLVQKVIREMKGPLVDSTDDFTAYPFAHSIPGGATYAGEADISQELLWRRLTLQGAYDGQGRAAGGGFFVQVDANTPEWNNMTPAASTSGTVEAANPGSPIATILAGNIVSIVGHNFTLDDVGKQVRITAAASGSLRLGSTFVIIDYINSENVVVEPAEYNPSVPTGGSYSYQVISGKHDGMPAAMSTHVLQSASFGRIGYFHEEDRIAARQFGHHFVGVRETDAHPSGEALSLVNVTFAGGTAWVTLPFDPTSALNVRALDGDVDASWAQSFVRITGTRLNDGWYLCIAAENTNRVRLMNFDGTYPVFQNVPNGLAHFYLPTQAYMDARPSATEAYRVGNVFFEDATAFSSAMAAAGYATNAHLGVLGVDWRGSSSGLVALINGPTWHAYKVGDAAYGSVINITTFMPANGVESWHYGAPQGTDLSPGGNNSAFAAERGGWAGAFFAETYSMRGDVPDAPLMQGTALYLAQKGADSALVAVGREQGGTHGAVPRPDDLTSVDGKATAVIVREDEWSMMQSGALELLGASYQWDPRSFWPGGSLHNMYGGTYTELSMGSRFSNSPISVASGVRYYTPDVSGGTKLSRLGQPGRMFPVEHGTASPAVALIIPAPASSRSHRTSGFIAWSAPTTLPLEDPSSYIGQQINLTAVDPTYTGVYTIINVNAVAATAFTAEVLRDGVTLPLSPLGAGNVAEILGSRWHFANVDLESFAMLGTGNVDNTSTFAHQLGAIAGVGTVAVDGLTPASRRDYASGTGRVQNGAGTWTLGLGTRTSRHPITNEAWHPHREPLGFGGSDTGLTNFETGEWAFRVVGPLRYNIDTSFAESFDAAGVGGSIRIRWDTPLDPGPFTPESLYAYVRVSELQFRQHYSYRVTLRLKHMGLGGATSGQTKTVRAALVDGIGGSLISVEKSFTMDFFADDEVTEVLLFDSSEMGFDLREAAADAMEDSGPVVLRLALGHTLSGEFPAGAHTMYIFQAAVEDHQSSVVAGHLISTGSVASAGFELHTEALDWKTYGPESAGPYGNIGYGDVRPLQLNSQGIRTPPAIQYVPDGGATIAGFLDLMSPSTFWFRGRNDAAFLFLGGKFAPPTLIDGAGTGAYDLNAATARRGGQVGHIVALDPPHGSTLSTLHVTMSIRPAGTVMVPTPAATTELLVLNGKTLNWGVVRDVACDAENRMEALEGYLIELWRYSALPTEAHPQDSVGTVMGSSEVGSWDDFGGGFSELIHSEVVDLEGVSFVEGTPGNQTDTACDGSPIVQALRNENFILTKIDLMDPSGDLKDEKLLHVDRRQYSYYVVIKAWGVGTPRELSTGTVDSTLYGTPFGGAFRWGVREIGGSPGEGITSAFNSFTRFKFRGATLACAYTRMNP